LRKFLALTASGQGFNIATAVDMGNLGYSALLIQSEIGDINRFPSAKQLWSYAGIIPSTYVSGDKIFHAHIIKLGSKWLRWILTKRWSIASGNLDIREQFVIGWRGERGRK